ncbi:MAG: dihydroneopterin aldolase [Halioglobus sp.]
MDRVYIEGLRVDTVIGIHAWEREIRQHVVLDIEMASDIAPAANSDAIADALDYAAMSERLLAFIGSSNYQLIETLAQQVATLLQEEFGVAWLRLKLSKPGAVPEAQAVGVIIERGCAD